MKKNLIIYSAAPINYENSIKMYGFDKINKNIFSTKIVDASGLYHSKRSLKNYRNLSSKKDKNFFSLKLNSLKEFKSFFWSISKASLIIILTRGPSNNFFSSNFDINFFNQNQLKYISFESLHKNVRCNFKKAFFFNLLKYLWNNLIIFFNFFKKLKYKPYLIVGSGNIFLEKKKEKKIINCSSIYINFEIKEKNKKNYIAYVDEGISQARDTEIYKQRFKKNYNTNKFLLDLNTLFSILEKRFNCEVIICCSLKYNKYENSLFNKRKIYYGKTSSLIQSAKLVLGHRSSALYQTLYSNNAVLFLKHKKFNIERNIKIDLFSANYFNQEAFFIEDIIRKKKINLNFDKYFRNKILNDYFISNNLRKRNFNYYFFKNIKNYY